MKRQVIKTDWAKGSEPVHVYEDEGPGRAESRAPSALESAPVREGTPGERGGRVKKRYTGLGQSRARS